MKKTIVLVALVAVLLTVFAYNIGYGNGIKHADNFLEMDEMATDYIGKIDYPLIDIAFNDGNEWSVVVATGIYSENPTYMVCDDATALQFEKEYLSVLTYPAGRGTTGNGSVTVYKNGQEVKCVEYFELTFANESIHNKFIKTSEDVMLGIIKQKPHAITLGE